ncbi:MAG: CHAT domain-containing protein [Leptolyngbyaceae cyanobacterium bins.302]|nr:CHAT domain-containing protein [Leptolyngbyaceae cyanobacterium bins.302]
MQQGRSLYQTGQFTQAIGRWQQALNHYQATKDDLNQALVLSYLSLAHQQLGNWSAATTAITTSLTLIHPTPHTPHPTPLILAQALNTQASLQFAQGQIEAALATWKRATDRYTQAGDTQRTIGSLINQAQAQQALGLFLQARKTLSQVEQRLQRQPDSQLKALGLRSLGNTLLLVGNGNDAERVLAQSLKITIALKLPQEASSVLLSLGNLARSQNNPTTALERYQQAAIQADPTTQLQAHLNQLSLLLDQQARSPAQPLPAQSLPAQSLLAIVQSQLDQQPVSRTTLYAEINFAQSLVTLGNREQAARRLALARQQAHELGDRRAEAYIIGYLGKVYEQTQQWTAAQQLTEQALLLAQSLNAADITYQWQWQLGRIHRAQGQRPAAIAAYAAAFQTLQSLRTDLVATSPDLQFSFRDSVEPVYREYVDALLQTPNPDQTTLKQARQVIESLQVAELNNFLRTACLDGQIVAIDSLPQTNAAVLYPIILKDRLELILSLPGQPLRRYNTAVSQQVVEVTLDQLRQILEQPITTPESKQLGQQIYTWLIQPIAADLSTQSLKTLVFVLDGSLRNVPMAALYDGKNYLIQRYRIALAPGLQLINPQPLQQKALRTIAAGLTEARHGFTALVNVNAEIQEIQSSITSRVLLNQAFTSAALQAQIQALPYPVVHLATHGQFSSNADETFILAWDKPIPVNELGALLRDRSDAQNRAIELLVLSACETAAGDKRAALGLAGLAIRAGARSTLASLWSLDDESGAKFMGEFYRELAKANVSRAEALQQAQLALLQDPDFRHPRYWAPYVLVGNWL